MNQNLQPIAEHAIHHSETDAHHLPHTPYRSASCKQQLADAFLLRLRLRIDSQWAMGSDECVIVTVCFPK